MNDLSNGDMREMCDSVEETVMKNINQKLEQLQPQIIASIKNGIMWDLDKKYSKRISRLEARISNFEKAEISQKESVVSKQTNNKATNRIDVSRLGYSAFKVNGWIYYKNSEMGDFLYRVREDGTENTQLTDYSVFSGFSVSNGYLHFQDCDFNMRKIKLV